MLVEDVAVLNLTPYLATYEYPVAYADDVRNVLRRVGGVHATEFTMDDLAIIAESYDRRTVKECAYLIALARHYKPPRIS